MPGTLTNAFYTYVISFSLQQKLYGTCIVIIPISDEETEAAPSWLKANDWGCASRVPTVCATNVRRI